MAYKKPRPDRWRQEAADIEISRLRHENDQMRARIEANLRHNREFGAEAFFCEACGSRIIKEAAGCQQSA